MIIVLAVLAVFTTVVMIHELGHFLVCRLLGVRVERFAIGFGKELFGFDWKGTRWSFCILPLVGGYVKPAGEEIEESTGAPDEFFGQSWYRRIAIAVAGPAMNYFLAFVCFFWLMFYWGRPQASTQPIVGEVVAGFPAQAAGLQKGDRILAINGREITAWEEMAKEIHNHPEKPLDIRFQRKIDVGSIEKIIALVPKKDSQRGIGLIGISPMIELKPEGFVDSLKSAWDQTVFWTEMTLKYLRDSILQRKSPELAGPIGIVSIIAKVAREGFQELVSLVALLSLSLGLFNFFPIPLLDGGHIFLFLLEGISGRALTKKTIRIANIIGATFLIAIFIYATQQDLWRLHKDFFR